MCALCLFNKQREIIAHSHDNVKVPLAEVALVKVAGDRNHPAHIGPFK